MNRLIETLNEEIEPRRAALEKLQRELAALESMLALAGELEAGDAKPVAAAPAPERTPRRNLPVPDLERRIVDLLEASPIWLRRGEIERQLGLGHRESKDVLGRLLKNGEIAAIGERAGRKYGPLEFPDGNGNGAPKRKKPPLPPEPPGTWERDSATHDSEPSRSCRVGDCVRVARTDGYCDEHAHMAEKFPVAA